MFGRKSLDDEEDIETEAEDKTEAIDDSKAKADSSAKTAKEEKTPQPAKNSAEDALAKLDIMAAADDAEEEEENSKGYAQEEADSELQKIKHDIYKTLMEKIDLKTANQMDKETLEKQIIDLIGEITVEIDLVLNQQELTTLAQEIADDMLGHGPLEPLLDDDSITDIMVNGPNQVYVERNGKLELSTVKFRDNAHVMNIAQRIVTAIGRRVDESTPVCDARLADGSRVNVIAQPLALCGCTISIRKFAKKKITLDIMAEQNNISEDLCKLLKIATASRLNIIISGGTGSGKTTLLNALSRMIDHGERIVTIEDAAELQLQQPHVVPLETRPANLEKEGEITMQDLVKNALRMRPDRVILGEVRGGEAMDMLQAMNTGHDGSLGTLHANNPREALTRLENMVNMAGYQLPSHVVRHQISSAVQLIVQIQRMRDGMRRVTHVTEVVGMEGDVIITQDLYNYNFEGVDKDDNLIGEFKSSGLRPHFIHKAEYFGLDKALLALM